MSSFDRRTCLIGAGAFALGGCGFAPAYGPGGGAARLDNAVLVDAPDTRGGYQLTRHLEDRLGRAAEPRYGLSYQIRLKEAPIAISSDNVTLRFNILGEITYALRDLSTEAVLTKGKVDSFSSYSASGTSVATQASRLDAEARLITILGDQIITRLAVAAPAFPA